MTNYKKQIECLAKEVVEGDQKAFKKLFDMLWEPLFCFAKSMLMDEQIAKDIIQEIWIDYWNRRTKIETTFIEAYLFKAVRNKTYNHFRNNKLNKIQLEAIKEIAYSSEVDEKYDYEHTSKYIHCLLNRLPNRCKEIFELSRLEGFTNDEIATTLGITKRSVENQLSLATKKLKS